VNILRNSLLGVAVAALMVLPATAAHAAPNETTTVVSTLNGSQGWGIDPPAFKYEFVKGPKTAGSGSLQFGPNASPADADKMFVKTALSFPPSEFRAMSFDYYFAPDSPVKTPSQFYLNIYVDDTSVPRLNGFYDCRFDYVATKSANGSWRTLTARDEDAASVVDVKNNAVCPPSIAKLPATAKFLGAALNAGDTSNSDNGMKGAFDNVVIKSKGNVASYDFDPAPVAPPTPVKACDQKGLPLISGTTGNDIKNGTDVAEQIELKAGNDISNAKGGADCVKGGEGNDTLTGGAGDDEIRAGAGNDIVNVKNEGVDTVDCGAGSDIVFADKNDTVSNNCETVQGRS
jgi:hypothetical protein